VVVLVVLHCTAALHGPISLRPYT